MRILEALTSLDPQDDGQWTEEGLPNLDVMRALVEDEELTREMITDVAPHFVRTNPELPDNDETKEMPLAEDGEGEGEEEPKESEEELKVKLDEGAQKLAEAKAKFEAAKLEYDVLLKEQDAVIEKLTETVDPPHVINQRNIMEHIQRQHKNREERAKTRAAVLGKLQGVDIPGRAPIDESMVARRARGTGRPAYPPKTS